MVRCGQYRNGLDAVENYALKKETLMNLSVIIPCYNEINTIEPVVQSVIDVIGDDGEIIIIDDCSTDGTRELLKQKADGKLARVIYQDQNRGKELGLPLRQKIS